MRAPSPPKLSFDVVVIGSGAILDGHIVAPAAGDMIHEIVEAMTAGATVRDIADAIHAFPTFTEGLKAAAGEWLNTRQQ
jgi:pyruvate/2-oxoglutarate dehydrogenase complex dihydrolipoamide dehydrogenase (E3) component